MNSDPTTTADFVAAASIPEANTEDNDSKVAAAAAAAVDSSDSPKTNEQEKAIINNNNSSSSSSISGGSDNKNTKKRPFCGIDEQPKPESSEGTASDSNKKLKSSPAAAAVADAAVVPLNIAQQLGLKLGDRLEVKWDIVSEDDNEGGDDGTAGTGTTSTHWWGCSLHAASCDDGVWIHTLDYDPYPEKGFLERSLEKVMFINEYTVLNVENGEEMSFRTEGSGDDEDEDIHVLSEDAIRAHLNKMLVEVTAKTPAWKRLDRAQQAHVADVVAKGKERLIQTLIEKRSSLITAKDIPGILEEAFGELRNQVNL